MLFKKLLQGITPEGQQDILLIQGSSIKDDSEIETMVIPGSIGPADHLSKRDIIKIEDITDKVPRCVLECIVKLHNHSADMAMVSMYDKMKDIDLMDTIVFFDEQYSVISKELKKRIENIKKEVINGQDR